MKKIDCIVFDYGNTLLLDPFHQIIRERSEEFRELIVNEGYRIRWQRVAQLWVKMNGEIDFPFVSHFYQEKYIVEQALRDVGIEQNDVARISERLLEEYRKAFKEILLNDKRKTEVSQTLSYLKKKGLKLGVLSNERQHVLDLSLRLYGIHSFFDLVLSSEKIRVEKPDATAFSSVLGNMNCDPDNTIYVGDDLIRDIGPAKKIGMTTVLYIPPRTHRIETSRRNSVHPEIKPDFVIKKLAELKKLVSTLRVSASHIEKRRTERTLRRGYV